MSLIKKKIETLEKERDLLKITLDHISKENLILKEENEDLRETVKHNKAMLKEYIESITNKDKTVQKMNSLIDQLTEKLKLANQYIKKKKYDEMYNNKSIIKLNIPINTTLIKKKDYELASKVQNKTEINETNTKANTGVVNVYNNSVNNLNSYFENSGNKSKFNYSPLLKLKNIMKPSDELEICSNCEKIKKEFFEEVAKCRIEIEELKNNISNFTADESVISNGKLLYSQKKINVDLNESQLKNLNKSINSNSNNKINNTCKTKQDFESEVIFNKMNLKLCYNTTDKLKKIFKNYNGPDNNLIILLDENYKAWEIVKRSDINNETNMIANLKNYKSILNSEIVKENYKLDLNYSRTLTNNLLDCSKISDFANISMFDY
jgi:hypothetical protein